MDEEFDIYNERMVCERALSYLSKSKNKADILKHQVALNKSLPMQDIDEPDGTTIHEKTICAVETCTTRINDETDQLSMAVDSISYPTIKDGMKPDHKHRMSDLKYVNWEGLAFTSEHSLNSGDERALRQITAAFSKIGKEYYNYKLFSGSVHASCFGEGSTFRHYGNPNNASAAKTEADFLDLVDRGHLSMYMREASRKRIVFAMDYYSGSDWITEDENIPVISAEMVITAGVAEYTKARTLKWDYVVTMYPFKAKWPQEVDAKVAYEALKLTARSALFDLGLKPYALRK